MFEEYLEETEYVNYSKESVKEKAEHLKEESEDEISLIKNTFYFVRDNFPHIWDIQDTRVTVSASEVLTEGVGTCWSKCNLLAALLRSNGIPTGFSYQRLTLAGTPESGYCLHGLNTVYISSLDKWIRLDARGKQEGTRAEFSLTEEKLEFEIAVEGEEDYHDNNPKPNEQLMKVLKKSHNALEISLEELPNKL